LKVHITAKLPVDVEIDVELTPSELDEIIRTAGGRLKVSSQMAAPVQVAAPVVKKLPKPRELESKFYTYHPKSWKCGICGYLKLTYPEAKEHSRKEGHRLQLVAEGET
jgi:hypothetical protein